MRPLALLLLAACTPTTATLVVTVDDRERVAAVGVTEAAVWHGEVDHEDGFSEVREDAVLPARFDVPPGAYTVHAAQGTANAGADVTVVAGETREVALELVFSE
ncbi:MAG: hypothetical protein H6732_04910 [Alphaproteobacteria bacterium]|nr:hypothetical protein [Alphaproteobacteria bacterium]